MDDSGGDAIRVTVHDGVVDGRVKEYRAGADVRFLDRRGFATLVIEDVVKDQTKVFLFPFRTRERLDCVWFHPIKVGRELTATERGTMKALAARGSLADFVEVLAKVVLGRLGPLRMRG